MPIKKYESLRWNHERVLLNVEGRQIEALFTNGTGYPRKVRGTYMTENVKIQNALEGRHDFKRRWKIVQVTPTRYEQESRARAEIDQVKNLKIDPIPRREPVPSEVKLEQSSLIPEDDPILEVTNAQKAKEYILQRFEDKTHRDFPNKNAILDFAREQGIEFPNWNG
jgi:hypothetical protein